MTTVVRIRRKNGVVVQGCDVYIGRRMTQGGWRLAESKWANRHKTKDHPLAECLKLYEADVRADAKLMAALPELEGKRLGCWCVGPRCVVCQGKRGGALTQTAMEMCLCACSPK